MRKMWKSMVAVILIVVMVLSISGCSATSKAERSVKGMFKSFSKLNFTSAEKYVDLEELQLQELKEELPFEVELFLRYMLDKMSYEIISSEEIDENNVDVKTKVTAVDPGPMLVEFLARSMKFSLSAALSEEELTEKQIEKKLKEILKDIVSDENLKMVTLDMTIRVTQENETWRVSAGNTLVKNLFGDLKGIWDDLEELVKLFQ